MISVSLLKSWRANRSYLVMLGGADLERILVTCVRILSAYFDGSR